MKSKIKELKSKNGITLIALVLTIIVLLILASVSIAMLTGDNGILKQATNAKEKTTKAEEEEKIKMAVMGCSIIDNGYADVIERDSLEKELTNQFGEDRYKILEDNGDGSFLISINDTQRKYYINDDKTVINSDNIIEINDEEELKTFRDDVNNGNSYEGKAVLLTDLLTDEIDLQNQEWKPIGFIDPDTDIKNPETGDNKAFKGIFDGGNYTIKNLKISSTENRYNGLFSFVVDGTIRNVIIGENSTISGSAGAGVVGYLYGFKGNISNCINYANTDGGGIAVNISGQHTVSNCKNYGTINGSGGIVGSSNGTDWQQFAEVSNKIINCGNYGNITKENGNYCGGIVGYFNGEILNCCNKANISGNQGNVGGIAGTNDGRIINCYSIGDISGQYSIGGIMGFTGSTKGGSVTNCYSIGTVSGDRAVGDIIGAKNGIVNPEIVNCYTKDDTFTASDLGDAFKEDAENINNGYPILYWE